MKLAIQSLLQSFKNRKKKILEIIGLVRIPGNKENFHRCGIHEKLMTGIVKVEVIYPIQVQPIFYTF